MCMVTCIRAFYGLSVFFGIVRIRTSTLHTCTVRALADALRAVRTYTGPLRARTSLIGLYPVWDPIGNPHDPVRLSTSLLWYQNRRKSVSESCASSTFSDRLYGAFTGRKILWARTACRWIIHRSDSLVLNPHGARKLLGSFMWSYLGDFVRTSYDTQTRTDTLLHVTEGDLGDFVRTSHGPQTRTTPKPARARDNP